MKLTNNISIYLFLVLSSSIILADDLSGLNQTSDSPIIQTDPNYSLSPTPEYYNDIIDSEQNGINNPDKSENHRNQDGKHNISDDNDSNNSEIISMSTNGQTVSNFYYTGAMQTYVVPAGVNSITIEAWGAEGGESDGSI